MAQQITGLPSNWLIAKTPCCQRTIRLFAYVDVPKEIFTRRCRGCGFLWQIERYHVEPITNLPGIERIDKLEWTWAKCAEL